MRRALALVVAACALAGCGGGDGDGGASGTALGRALDTVEAGDAAKSYLEWGDTERLTDLAGILPDGAGKPSGDDRFLHISLVGFGPLATGAVTLRDTAGLVPFAAEDAVSIGTAPRVATRLSGSGIKPTAAERPLRDAGAETRTADGEELFILGEEGNSGIDRLDEFGTGLGREWDRVAISDDAIAVGAYEEPVLELTGEPDSPLGEEPDHAAAAACLGDVSYAIIAAATADSRLDEVPGSPSLVAVGGRIDDAKHVDEVACVVYDDEGAAGDEAEVLKKSMAPEARLPSVKEPLSTLISNTEVDVVRDADRSAARAVLTLKPDVPPGLLYDAFVKAELRALLGTPARPVGP